MDDPVLRDIENLAEEDLAPVKKSRYGKILVYFLAIFMLGITVIYFLPGDVVQVLEGRGESDKLEEFSVDFDGGKVIFDPEIYQKIRDYYLSEEGPEIKVCMKGHKEGFTYYIDDYYVPEIHSQSVFHVSSEGCSEDTLIPLHSHPVKHCLFSEQDISSYRQFKKINPEAIVGLMCEVDRLNFYRD